MGNYNIIFKRIISFLIDLVILGFIAGVVSFFIDIFMNSFEKSSDIIFYFSIILFLFRDIILKDGSIGKKLLKLKIVDLNSNSTLFIIKKIIRNITTVLWPIEGLILLIFKRRIGDFISGTDVVQSDQLPAH
jgi:uncharacterized RDD family membrane protein YckC